MGNSFVNYTTSTPPKNYYTFNGMEFQQDNNLNTFDFHARMYDPQIGRTFQPDPLADQFLALSPYSFLNNNPINFMDPTGMKWIDKFYEGNGGGGGWNSTGGNDGSGRNPDGTPTGSENNSGLVYDFNDKTYYYNGNAVPVWLALNIIKSTFSYDKYTYNEPTIVVKNAIPVTSGAYAGAKIGGKPVLNYNIMHTFVKGMDGIWGKIADNISKYTNPAEDLAIGAAEYNVGKILVDRAKYGNVHPETIIRTPITNISVSTKGLQNIGTALKWSGRAFGALGLIGTYGQWQTGAIGNTEAALDATFGAVGFAPGYGWALSGAYFLIVKPLYNYAIKP